MGDIGTERRHIELVPAEAPSRQEVPTEPMPVIEPEKQPA
jgi:hypothetical protein